MSISKPSSADQSPPALKLTIRIEARYRCERNCLMSGRTAHPSTRRWLWQTKRLFPHPIFAGCISFACLIVALLFLGCGISEPLWPMLIPAPVFAAGSYATAVAAVSQVKDRRVARERLRTLCRSRLPRRRKCIARKLKGIPRDKHCRGPSAASSLQNERLGQLTSSAVKQRGKCRSPVDATFTALILLSGFVAWGVAVTLLSFGRFLAQHPDSTKYRLTLVGAIVAIVLIHVFGSRTVRQYVASTADVDREAATVNGLYVIGFFLAFATYMTWVLV